MNNTTKLLAVGRALMASRARNIANTSTLRAAADEVHPGYKKIRKIQEKFQVEDGLEVHMKGGLMDVVLYRLTMGLCVAALGYDVYFYYSLAYPSKK